MYYLTCPKCGEEHRRTAYNNFACGCGVQLVWREMPSGDQMPFWVLGDSSIPCRAEFITLEGGKPREMSYECKRRLLEG